MIRDSQCVYCRHLIRLPRKDISNQWCCKAFPDGIPQDIKHSHKIHNKPFPDDHGILFDQDPDIKLKFDIEKAGKEINGE